MNTDRAALIAWVKSESASWRHCGGTASERWVKPLDAIAALLEAEAWQPIATAPKETPVWVGRWVDGEWRTCESAFCYDAGTNSPNGYEPASWFWAEDCDTSNVTTGDGPTHWRPLPAPPVTEVP